MLISQLFFRKFHTHILQFDGTGTWKFSELNAKDRIDLKNEKEGLLQEQEGTQECQDRLDELNKLLGEDS